MSRRMDYTLEFDAPAEKIYQDFTNRDYWQTLMDAYRFLTPQSEITTFLSGERGTDIVFVQNLPRMYLPPIARTVVPVDMIITRKQHFDPFDHAKSRAKGTYSASIPHGPGSFSGQYFLTETDTGSRMRLASVCKVYIPFVGGALEDLMLHLIKLVFDTEEAFTADWIREHH
ncbi:MAG: hypothetical protein QOJ20_4901 [Mycobacterium sp.]|jgi:hypothetical protein|nr:hypothetical protein [Mycobacterium sp.]MDT5283706.1 hypothetical protein [Mycobacterium sp.]